MIEYVPSDLQYKDDLRKQRDDWAVVMKCLELSGIKDNPEIDKAKEKVEMVLNRIRETLQD